MNHKKSILLGMSGGSDSTYSAHLLKEQGFNVTGVFLKMHDLADETDAAVTAKKLDIPFVVTDCREDFEKYVAANFIGEYLNGRTPNPCVVCNRYVKIAKLIETADKSGIDFIATGHYTKIKCNDKSGRYYICKAKDERKDQSYFLWNLTNKQLSRLITPLAEYTKDFIKDDLIDKGIFENKIGESQEICFIPDGDYKAYIEKAGGKFQEGNFISKDGKILGRHKGIANYTIGQKKRLGIALGVSYTVTNINADNNTVTIEPTETAGGLLRDCFSIDSINFGYCESSESVNNINKSSAIYAKIRFAAKPVLCDVKFTGDDSADIVLHEPAKAVTPGQSCVIYVDDGDGDLCVAAGGIIK